MSISDRPTEPSDVEQACEPATHIASMARALVAMGDMATSISTRQHVTPGQATLIRRLLPALADRKGLDAAYELCGEVLTVTFTRRDR